MLLYLGIKKTTVLIPKQPRKMCQKMKKMDNRAAKPSAPADQAGQTNNRRHSREVTVESVVRLDDKPELFKNLVGK